MSRRSDMLKLADAFYKALERDRCEYGGWGIDDKRPFGNSDVEGDILEILGAEMEGDDGHYKCWSRHQHQYAASLYDELGKFLEAEWKRYRDMIRGTPEEV